MVLSSLQQRLPTICLDMWTLTVTSGSAFTAPQNVQLAVVDCKTSPAQVSGRECCQHTDAPGAGRRSDIEGPKAQAALQAAFSQGELFGLSLSVVRSACVPRGARRAVSLDSSQSIAWIRLTHPPGRSRVTRSNLYQSQILSRTVWESAFSRERIGSSITAPSARNPQCWCRRRAASGSDVDHAASRPLRQRRDDQARGRDNAVVGAEHRCSQPTGAANEVALRVEAKATHPTSYPSDQIRPVRSSTTTTIRMIPMTPTPP
jgi:hypothetical protein